MERYVMGLQIFKTDKVITLLTVAKFGSMYLETAKEEGHMENFHCNAFFFRVIRVTTSRVSLII